MQVIDGCVRAVCQAGCTRATTDDTYSGSDSLRNDGDDHGDDHGDDDDGAVGLRRRLPRATTVTPLARGLSRPLRAMGIAAALTVGALAAWAAAPSKLAPLASLRGALDHDDLSEGFEELPQPIDGELFDVGDPEELTDEGEERLEVRFPSLADWVHPVLGVDSKIPDRSSRRFGAKRDGERPEECGKGHCGVDVFAERGRPVVAVAFGVITIVRHDPNRRSGRYVRVRHPEGAETAYMHLDAIAPGLRRGQEVEPGQLLGTLGRTGITRSAAHLHFSLSVPVGHSSRYVDPLAYLRSSTVLDSAVGGSMELVPTAQAAVLEQPKAELPLKAEAPSKAEAPATPKAQAQAERKAAERATASKKRSKKGSKKSAKRRKASKKRKADQASRSATQLDESTTSDPAEPSGDTESSTVPSTSGASAEPKASEAAAELEAAAEPEAAAAEPEAAAAPKTPVAPKAADERETGDAVTTVDEL